MTRTSRRIALSALSAWLVVCAALVPAAGQPHTAPDLTETLARLAARVQEYYDRIGTIICIETVTQQETKFNLAPTGRPRVTVWELSVTRDPKGQGEKEFRLERTLQSVNGKAARKNQEHGCTDPRSGTPEPLGFLLAKNQHGFRFSTPRNASGGPDGTVALDFAQSPPERVNVTWEGNCFEADGGGLEGRLWFDPHTFDVLQVHARLPKPFPVPIPSAFGGASAALRVERSEMILRFSRVHFDEPDEDVLLPASAEVITVFRGAPSLKTTDVLSNFRRFLAQSIVRPATM